MDEHKDILASLEQIDALDYILMRIVTWNCNGAFRKKYQALEEYAADILIVQECEDPALSTKAYREWAGNCLWKGDNKNKGIGVFPRPGVNVSELAWSDGGLQLFLPCRVNESFNLLAVWTKYADSPNFRYIGQLWKYLQLNSKLLMSDRLVLCGDFNSNTCWDEWDRWWNHSDVVTQLEEINVSSIYHRYFKEEQSAESRPTLFHHRKIEKPYHVDYAFCTESMFVEKKDSLDVGEPSNWLEFSDHMPLAFTVTE